MLARKGPKCLARPGRCSRCRARVGGLTGMRPLGASPSGSRARDETVHTATRQKRWTAWKGKGQRLRRKHRGDGGIRGCSAGAGRGPAAVRRGGWDGGTRAEERSVDGAAVSVALSLGYTWSETRVIVNSAVCSPRVIRLDSGERLGQGSCEGTEGTRHGGDKRPCEGRIIRQEDRMVETETDPTLEYPWPSLIKQIRPWVRALLCLAPEPSTWIKFHFLICRQWRTPITPKGRRPEVLPRDNCDAPLS